MSDALTAAVALWGAILGTLSGVVLAARFLSDRPRLKIDISLGEIPVTIIDGVEAPTAFGLAPGAKIVALGATKLGRGSRTVQSVGLRTRDGRVQFMALADRRLPVRLEESDRVTFVIAGEALVE